MYNCRTSSFTKFGNHRGATKQCVTHLENTPFLDVPIAVFSPHFDLSGKHPNWGNPRTKVNQLAPTHGHVEKRCLGLP